MTDLLRAGAPTADPTCCGSRIPQNCYPRSTVIDEPRRINAGVVRNGYLPERELQTGLGPVTVQIPKVRAKTGEAVTFRSALVPPYIRKTKSMEAAVPWLYLKGVSSGEMGDALRVRCRSEGAGPVSEHGIALETGLGPGVPHRVRPASGRRPAGSMSGPTASTVDFGPNKPSCVRWS